LALLPAPVDSQVRLGRYVYADGTLHRSPMGDGGFACSGPGSSFTPAPGGAAVGVLVMPPGVTRIDPAAGRFHLSPRWMDLRGRPQASPSTQTRGIIDRGRRLWVDVFPG
jgi:hypothetical protein